MANEAAPSLADIVRRLEVLEAEREILRRLHEYGPGIDYGDEEAWVDGFVPGGVFDIGGQARPRRYEGSASLASFIINHSHVPSAYHKHCVLGPLIEVDGSRATATSYFVRIDQTSDGPRLQAFGRYHDLLERGDDGRWRFIRRNVEVEADRNPGHTSGTPSA